MTESAAFANLPEPPYYAVMFSSLRKAGDDGYGHAAERMVELAARQSGFLGAESARGSDGFGITVSYWQSEADIAAWRAHAGHRVAIAAGFDRWYACFATRVAYVGRDHLWDKPASDAPGQG